MHIRYWSNRLRINQSKTEFLCCATSRLIDQIDDGSFHVGVVDVKRPKPGVMMEGDLSMIVHVYKIVCQSLYLLRKIKSSFAVADATVTLVTSPIWSRIDYCNTIFPGLLNSTIGRLQSVLHAASRIITGVGNYDHITPTLRRVSLAASYPTYYIQIVPDCLQDTARHDSFLYRWSLTSSSCWTLQIAAALCNMRRLRCSTKSSWTWKESIRRRRPSRVE